MAATALTNIVVPEIWAADIARAREKASALIRSGMFATTPSIQQQLDAGGELINMPYMNPIAGASEVITSGTALTVNAQTGLDVKAPRMFRGKAWGWDDIVDWVRQPGESLVDAAVRQIGAYWAEDEQATAIAVLTGIFATTLSATHVYDGTAAVIGASSILNASQLLGDYRKNIAGLICHSKVAKDLEVAELVDALRNSEAETGFTLYMNRFQIIEDDDCPVTAGTPDTYHSYLFAAGSMGYGHANLPASQAVEVERAALLSSTNLITRQNVVISPVGVSYTGVTMSPSNTVLATGANWTKKYPDKMVGLVQLNTQ